MNLLRKLGKHEEILYSYVDKMNKNNYKDILNDIYSYVKSITDIYYKNEKMEDLYICLISDMIFAEEKFRNQKILNIKTDFEAIMQNEDLMKHIVYLTRRSLMYERSLYGNDIDSVNFANYCQKASEYTKDFCDKYNVESYILPIFPGYGKELELFGGAGYHYFNIVKYNNKYYLVDVTYSQFFYTAQNNLNRLGVVGLSGCRPGVFMLMDEKRKSIATTLLKQGYIELDESIFKTYLDCFTISFRNGLYYEYHNDFSYTTQYSVDDYIKFLIGEDNQANHEDKEFLGYQKRPLKNSKLVFYKR